MESRENRTEQEDVVKSEAEGTGPTISHNATKVLEECVRAMVDNLPPSGAQKNESRVKRPMNAFMIYSQTARKAMARHYPTLSYRKLSKALGKIWRVLNAEEKKPFMREAERLRQKHKHDYPDYKFKPNKTRKPRPQASLSKEYCAPNTQDVKMIMKAECDVRPSCQKLGVVTPPFNGCQGQEGNTFNQTRLEEEHQSRTTDEEAYSYNCRAIENLPLEEDLVPLIDNILNGSSEILQRELFTTQPTMTAIAHFQPTNYGENFSIRDSPVPQYPVNQGLSQDHYFSSSNEPDLLFHYSNGNAQYYTGQTDKSPVDFENFCNFISTDKPVSQIPITTTPQNDYNDTSKVFINL